jgi:DNA-binding transcriptional regulator YbjK
VRTIADAAIDVLASQGSRGLTHRAVDAAASLPPGSTSYYLRTREALLQAVVDRMLELDLGDAGPVELPTDIPGASLMIAAMLTDFLTRSPKRTLARYELSLETCRYPELHETVVNGGRGLRELAVVMLEKLGSADPRRHARMLVAFCDGMLYESLIGAGSGHPPTEAELVSDVRDLLTAMCAQVGLDGPAR